MIESHPRWTFLSNHAQVMILLSRDPDLRMRDLAAQIGITERAVQRLVSELTHDGYLKIRKDGRRNHYEIVWGMQLRHPIEAGVTIEALLALVASPRSEACESPPD